MYLRHLVTGISHADACALQWSPDVSVCLIFKSVGGLKGAKLIPEFSANPRVTVSLACCLNMIRKCSFLWPLALEDSPKNRRKWMRGNNLHALMGCLLRMEGTGVVLSLLGCIVDETQDGESRLVLLCLPSRWKNKLFKPTWGAGQRRRRGREREGNERWHWGQRDRRCQFLAWSEIMRIMFDRQMGC